MVYLRLFQNFSFLEQLLTPGENCMSRKHSTHKESAIFSGSLFQNQPGFETGSAVFTGEAGTASFGSELVRAGTRLSSEQNFNSLVSILVEQAQDISCSDLAAFYAYRDGEEPESDLRLMYRRGRYRPPDIIAGTSEIAGFLRECREALIFNNRGGGKVFPFLRQALLVPEMKSGMALPVTGPSRNMGV
ncbi:MAG: hypothetical protein LBD71_01770, partial [Treponema sp.]|nr:hypothetical protein [Treponema sp.]